MTFSCFKCGRFCDRSNSAIFAGFDGENRIYCLICLSEFGGTVDEV